MSSKPVHFASGTALGLLVAFIVLKVYGPPQAVAVLFGAIAGSSAPDWFEISRWKKGKKRWFKPDGQDVRQSLIGHRTLTHWFLLWAFLTPYCFYVVLKDPSNVLHVFFLGFVISGLLHVLMDARTPMGIPVLHPWRRTPGRKNYYNRAKKD
jgi:membrane-bound metal-dependent hydrolase YbcI (DUF457 family)